jgi:hypothetical protein
MVLAAVVITFLPFVIRRVPTRFARREAGRGRVGVPGAAQRA